MAAADREQQRQFALVRHVLDERFHHAAEATRILVLGASLLVLTGVPATKSGKYDEGLTVWDAGTVIGFAVLAVHLVAALGSMAVGRSGDYAVRAHRVLAGFAALVVVVDLVVLLGAIGSTGSEVAAGLWLMLLVAALLVDAHVKVARRRRGEAAR